MTAVSKRTLDPTQPVAAELARLAGLDLTDAITALDPSLDHRSPDADAVHLVRKRLKRLRALVRLGTAVLGHDLARAENTAYRDLGRRLSGRRDREAMVETVERLRHAAAKSPSSAVALPAALLRLEAQLGDSAASQPADGAESIAAVRAGLVDARNRLHVWPRGDEQGWELLAPGLLRQYAAGRTALRSLGDEPSDEALHLLRKRTKDHWAHLEFLVPAWPKVLNATAEQAHHLADLLGEDHDLAVLAATTTLEVPVGDLVVSERSRLQGDARWYGTRIYAEPAKRLGRRLGEWWPGG